ncbi:hypothetical protein AAVH_15705 [Aphelenchoides avenae]|nr:hypothetical protein AAVH_15705 [Aphelenchus avenae]
MVGHCPGREKTQLSNDILLDIFAWLQRFELDIMHVISRKFRDAADASVPQFSYRYINVVEYRNGRMEFSVNVFFRGEIAVRNYDSCPDYFSAVQSDRRRWLVAESDTKRAFRRLRYSFVEFFFVQQVPKPSVLDLLRGPEATFLVGTLVLYRALLKRVSAKAFSRLVFSFKGFNELVVTRSLLNRRLLTDDFLRHCASQGITYVAVDGHSRQCTQLTDNGLLSFVATVVRSCNVTCRLLVGSIKPAASEWLLFKPVRKSYSRECRTLTAIQLSSAKQGKLVDYFCVALANAPEQLLGEYEPLRQQSKISHFSWRLYVEQIQLEAYRGRKSLYIARNHSKVNCDCLVRVIALNRDAKKRITAADASLGL